MVFFKMASKMAAKTHVYLLKMSMVYGQFRCTTKNKTPQNPKTPKPQNPIENICKIGLKYISKKNNRLVKMFKAPFAIPVPHRIVDDMTPYSITPYETPGVLRSPERIKQSKS